MLGEWFRWQFCLYMAQKLAQRSYNINTFYIWKGQWNPYLTPAQSQQRADKAGKKLGLLSYLAFCLLGVEYVRGPQHRRRRVKNMACFFSAWESEVAKRKQ